MTDTQTIEKPDLVLEKDHQLVVDAEGNTTAVLVPYAQYAEMMEVVSYQRQYKKLEKKLHSALKEAKEIVAGKRQGIPLLDLLNED